jgi:hypothetical protein
VTSQQILTILLALSVSLNAGFVAGFLATRSGSALAQAALIGGSAMGGGLALFFAAVAAYR